MSSAGAVEVSSSAQSLDKEESSTALDEEGSDTEAVQDEVNKSAMCEEIDDSVDNSRGLDDSIIISDSENEVPSRNNISKSEDDEEEDVITITANDGSLGRGHLIAPKPPMPSQDYDDDDVELLDDEDGSNSMQALPNGQDEDDLLADEESSLDNRVYNEMDSSLSNDNITPSNKKQARIQQNDDDDDVLLISDEESSMNSSVTKNSTGSGSRSGGSFNLNHAGLLAKSGLTIENVSVSNSRTSKVQQEDEIMEIEEADPLAGCDGISGDDDNSLGGGDNDDDDEDTKLAMLTVNGDSNGSDAKANQMTIVVNDTKSLVELANSSGSKKESGKEPTLVIIDTNSILAGKGPLPINNNNKSAGNFPNNSSHHGGGQSRSNSRSILNNNSSIDIPDDAFLIEAPSFIVPYVFEQSGEQSLKECIKEVAEKAKAEKEAKIAKGEQVTAADDIQETKKPTSEDYFETPVGKLLMNIGMNMVQEYVQVDLLKMQKRQGEKEKVKNRMGMMTHLTQQSIISLKKNIEESKENNEPFRSKTKKCELCNFKTESAMVLSTHQETPHMKNYSYRCNFCTYTTKVPQEIIFHMEAEHTVKARLERAPAYHQCPNCPFEDNSKAKLTRHLLGCTKRFTIDKNLEPPMDWDTPAKLPKLPKNRMLPQGINPAFLAPNHQRSLQGFSSILPKHMQNIKGNLPPLLQAPKNKPIPGLIRTNNPRGMNSPIMNPHLQRGMIVRGSGGMSQQIQQAHLQLNNNQMLQQVVSGQLLGIGQGAASGFLTKLGLQPSQATVQNASMQKSASPQNMRGNVKPTNQPSISITPLPRQAANPSTSAANQQKPPGKTSFVICEICDGYIKDLDQLRNHMQWIHKVKIHPKMIYNKPPLNCQKCQFRFFTDQGLERHLLGSHGLVTSSMQDAANKGQDSGRCPLCGKVYQWKLLAHVAKDHNVTLKPAHLSYKCTVCTATFGMYKLFESHVYSAHSVTKNAPRPERRSVGGSQQQMPGKMSQLQVTPRTMPTSTSQANSYKPLKINDEITIIPQPMANASPAHRNKGSLTITPQPMARRNVRNNEDEGIQIIEIDDNSQKHSSNGRTQNGDFKARFQMTETLRKRNLEISLCGTDSDNSDDSRGPPKRLRQN